MNIPANDNRRETALAARLCEEIARDGPLPVSRFMERCLRHPDCGYYTAQRAIGAEGDFITAPEISQIFGELIGLWSAVVWQTIGSPKPCQLIEIGPGRGTLVCDALRALRDVPGIAAALSVHLIEVSPILRAAQEALIGASHHQAQWHETPSSVGADVPRIIIANEFLDTLPIEQYIATEAGPRLRTVTVGADGQLGFSTDDDAPVPPSVRARLADAAPGTIVECPAHGFAFLETLFQSASEPAVALFIDYGHEAAANGETLQAVRAHQFEHVLTSPGEADLSVQVDFSALLAAAHALGLESDGPVAQAEFLGQLGMLERASRLMNANPDQAGTIETGVLRLMAPNGMGTRFKAVALKSPGLPELPGFARVAQA